MSESRTTEPKSTGKGPKTTGRPKPSDHNVTDQLTTTDHNVTSEPAALGRPRTPVCPPAGRDPEQDPERDPEQDKDVPSEPTLTDHNVTSEPA